MVYINSLTHKSQRKIIENATIMLLQSFTAVLSLLTNSSKMVEEIVLMISTKVKVYMGKNYVEHVKNQVFDEVQVCKIQT